MVRVPPPFLIAGRNPVISGHGFQDFQTPPLRALRPFFRFGYGRFRRGVRVLFPLRPYGGKPLTDVRARRDLFRRAERRAFRGVPVDGDVSFFHLRQRFEGAFVNRGARGVPYRARGRMPGVRAYARVRSRVVFGRFGLSGRRPLTQTRRRRAPFVLRRKDVPGARPLRRSETKNRHVVRPSPEPPAHFKNIPAPLGKSGLCGMIRRVIFPANHAYETDYEVRHRRSRIRNPFPSRNQGHA